MKEVYSIAIAIAFINKTTKKDKGEPMHDVITTERLILKSFSDNDQEPMVQLLTNEKIKETFMVPDFPVKDDAVNMFKKLQEFSLADDHFTCGVYAESQLIGFFTDVEVQGDEIELGYVINPDYQNKGYATEALKASIQYLLQNKFIVITAGAFANNTASMRVMEKCGMQRCKKKTK